MRVDPAGLAMAAQRIVEALGELMTVDPVHPPLAADPASLGGAARLSVAGSLLAATFAEQAMGLALTAEQLTRTGAGFEMVDSANASNIGAVVAAAGAAASAINSIGGWAPASPPLLPDVRPPLIPPPPVPGEALSTAVHSGEAGGGAEFISAWSHLSRAAEAAADTVRGVAANLPAVWDGPTSTDVVRAHLTAYAESLDASGRRAGEVAEQATNHGEQLGQARNDIPSPEQFQALREQLARAMQANVQSGGKYAGVVAQLTEQLNELNARATAGYGSYHAATDQTTAGTGDPAGAQQGDKPNELAQMLPQLVPQLLQAMGGMVGGLFGSVGQVPQALMQAGSQAAQSLTGMMKGGGESLSGKIGDPEKTDAFKTGKVGSGAGGGGGGATMPAGGGARMAASVPSTGRTPTAPHTPSGGLPPPVNPGAPTGGGMPMGMGGMPMGGHGGGAPAGGKEAPMRPKNLVVPQTPNTEAVTGKVGSDRIAMSAGASGKGGGSSDRENRDESPDPDDSPPNGPRQVVRRIITTRDDDG